MSNSIIYNRTIELQKRLNQYLEELTGNKSDYFSELSQEKLIDLKIALSDINNVFTLKTTLSFADWLADFFKLESSEKTALIDEINKVKPNTNGFDVKLTGKTKVVAEIKCIVPINSGNYYGAAQRLSIMDDGIKLLRGKKNDIKDTSPYIKIIGLLDLGDKTDKAIDKLLISNIMAKHQKAKVRHNVVKKFKELTDEMMAQNLDTESIYIKKIRIN